MSVMNEGWSNFGIEVMYSEVKYKRVIERDTGDVVGYIAYEMARDYSHVRAAPSIRHPDDKHDAAVGKAIAAERLTTAHAQVLTSSLILEFDGHPYYRITDMLLETGFRYVQPHAVLELIYSRFNIPTSRYR